MSLSRQVTNLIPAARAQPAWCRGPDQSSGTTLSLHREDRRGIREQNQQEMATPDFVFPPMTLSE